MAPTKPGTYPYCPVMPGASFAPVDVVTYRGLLMAKLPDAALFAHGPADPSLQVALPTA